MKKIIMNIILLLSASNLLAANGKVDAGEQIRADHFNGVTSHVGEVKMSILLEPKFQELYGDCWVQMNKTITIAGTDLENHTSITSIPDASGRFIRQTGGYAPALATTQESNSSGSITMDTTGGLHGGYLEAYYNNSGTFMQRGSDNTQFFGRYTKTFNFGSGETRSANISMNYFVKINETCN